jgi:membrane protein DedA with SNARE-associated domain
MKIFFQIIFVIFLAILQVSVIPHISIFGVKPNLILAGFPALFYLSSFWEILPAVLIGGLFYDLSDFYLGAYSLPFLTTFLLLWFLSRKYISGSHFLVLGILGTIIFNFLFLSFGYVFGMDHFFDYFLSWRHLIEIILNGILAVLFGLAASFIKNRKS